jgi:hypothetical protein
MVSYDRARSATADYIDKCSCKALKKSQDLRSQVTSHRGNASPATSAAAAAAAAATVVAVVR